VVIGLDGQAVEIADGNILINGLPRALPEKSAIRLFGTVPLTSVGNRPALAEYAAIEYAPSLAKFVYYSAQDGSRVYTIDPPNGAGWRALTSGTWTWRCALDATNMLDPVADALATTRHAANWPHTFGRFRVASWGDTAVALLIRHVDSPVYAMLLPTRAKAS